MILLNFLNRNDEEKESLFPILFNHSQQFHLPGDKLGSAKAVTHKIITSDNKPVNMKNFRQPPIHKKIVLEKTKEYIQDRIIQPSISPYNSHIWVIPKKPDSRSNKQWRIVVDYRGLNEKTISDSYPLPQVTDIFEQLGDAKYFSVMDLASGFHQIPMDPESKAKTAFSTPYAHYKFNRMPLGHKNAPATFQRLMDQVLTGLQGIELFVYMDDIVIYASSLVDHNQKLKASFRQIKSFRIITSTRKMSLFKKGNSIFGTYHYTKRCKTWPFKSRSCEKLFYSKEEEKN